MRAVLSGERSEGRDKHGSEIGRRAPVCENNLHSRFAAALLASCGVRFAQPWGTVLQLPGLIEYFQLKSAYMTC